MENFCNDVFSTLLQYLKGADLLHFKLTCSHFKQIVEKVVPLHRIISIFQSILNNDQEKPPLYLPTDCFGPIQF